MEKTLKYTTLKGLLKAQSKHSQFSLNTFRSRRFCHNKHGWSKFKISDAVENEIINLFHEVAGNVYLFGGRSYGIYDRLIIELRNKKVYCSYIAGQHYPSEIRELRKCLN